MKKQINKEIIKLSIPNILSNISVPLLSTVDTILMGGLSNIHLAAVGLGSFLFNVIYWNFGFLRMGTTGMTAQNYGANNKAEVWLSLLRAAVLSIILAILLLVLQFPIYELAKSALVVSAENDPLILEYFKIRIWAAPAALMLMVVMGWLFGMQNAIYPLILTIIINIVNIITSYYLVKVAGLDVRGVALGTVIAQYTGLIIGLGLILKKYQAYINWSLSHRLSTLSEYSRFLKVNFDLFLRTLCLTFSFGFFYRQSSKLGDVVLAVNVVLMQFVNWMSYGIDGFAYATESLVGKYKGAKKTKEVKMVIGQSFLWGGLVSMLYAAVYCIFGIELFGLFSDDPSLLAVAKELLYFMSIFPILGFASYIWDGIFVGLTATTSMRNAMVMALVVYLISFYMIPETSNGSNVWIALSIFLVARAVFQWGYYKKYGLEMK
ncbi:MAG: MATE family multidrug resistance protein [Saprospiraceae bacterium]|jgi:MATE family multidrug resistance protein